MKESNILKCKCGCGKRLAGTIDDWSDDFLDKEKMILKDCIKRIQKEQIQRDPNHQILHLQKYVRNTLTWITGIREHKETWPNGEKYSTKNPHWNKNDISFTKNYRQRMISETPDVLLNGLYNDLSLLKLAIDDMLEMMSERE